MPQRSDLSEAVSQLAMHTEGEGDARVVLLHGWSCRASDWDGVRAALAGDFPLLIPDLPGHGQSADVPWEDWTIVGLARLVVELAREQGVRQLTLVGHSMGGTVALEAARLWAEESGPENLLGVVLVDTFGLPYGDMDADTIESIEAPFREDFAGAMRFLVESTTASALPAEKREWVVQRMASANPALMLPLWADLLRWTPEAAFAELDCPIHAINGEHIPEPAQKRCAPHVQTRVMAGGHHFPLFEVPDAFNQALRDLLLSLRP